VSADDLVELELAELLEGGDPLGRKAVRHEGHPAVEEVARGHDLLFREVDDDVAARVAAAEEE
jgi:hypothetical protein